MREGIHPEYQATTFSCSCGNVIKTNATIGDQHIEICDNCHPFYTGKSKLVDTAGRVERFNARYAANKTAAAKTDVKTVAKK